MQSRRLGSAFNGGSPGTSSPWRYTIIGVVITVIFAPSACTGSIGSFMTPRELFGVHLSLWSLRIPSFRIGPILFSVGWAPPPRPALRSECATSVLNTVGHRSGGLQHHLAKASWRKILQVIHADEPVLPAIVFVDSALCHVSLARTW